MDRQIENAQVKSGQRAGTRQSPDSSGHLMCRAPVWGVAGFLGCAYFAGISFLYISRNEYEWPHDYWTAATYIVWVLLLTWLVFDTPCVRERGFFGVLVVNFMIGCGLTLWRSVLSTDVRTARIVTGTLWGVAALVSLTTLGNAPPAGRDGARSR
jgi:hypothetical protein